MILFIQFIPLQLPTGWTTGVQYPAGTMMGFFTSPPCPDGPWGPPSLLFNAYRRLLPRE